MLVRYDLYDKAYLMYFHLFFCLKLSHSTHIAIFNFSANRLFCPEYSKEPCGCIQKYLKNQGNSYLYIYYTRKNFTCSIQFFLKSPVFFNKWFYEYMY